MGLDNVMDLLEKHGFQRLFKNKLLENNDFVEGTNNDFNIAYAIDEKMLFTFLETTQPKQYQKISNKVDFKSKFIKYLREQIKDRGLLDVFRKPVKWNGAHFNMMITKPHNNLNPIEVEKYKNNIVGVTEELVYNPEIGTGAGGRGDLTIFVNGLPLIWIELKSNSAGQDINNALKQYYKDRNPEELIFRYKQGCLVYFAMDLEEVAFTTKLNKFDTHFMPFNKGNGMHKGNPDIEDNIKTSYMWDEILTKDNILEWLENYIVNDRTVEIGFDGKKKVNDKIVFPRYHQFKEVNAILSDILEKGVSGQNYLIMDSPGSGKTYSIAWLAHHLASLHDENDNPIYNSVIVITDRLVVDNQLQKAILTVPHVEGTVETMGDDCSSEDLAEALNNDTKVIVSSIQKFSFILDKVSPMSDKTFAIIIDECHSSTKGSYISNVGKALSQEEVNLIADDDRDDEDVINDAIEADIQKSRKHNNITLIGFSATPKKKTLELFGTKYPDPENPDEMRSRPFSVYSMQQAIEEGFILDVLKNYTTYKTYFKINKKINDNPEYKKKKTEKAVLKYANLQPENICQKVEIIIEHFLEKVEWQLDGTAKAMVVADSREGAVRYKLAFDEYIEQHNLKGIKALVAFTSSLKLDENGPDYSESKMNGFSDSKTKDMFNTSEYQVLLVANKYQTGYDQPLLVAMYVDKQLKGTSAVQTLGRLNRMYPGKTEVFVLDFRNDYEDIKQSFAPYYTDLELVGETDPNLLYQLESFIDSFKFVKDDDLKAFLSIAIKDRRSVSDVAKWNGILSKAKSVYDAIPEEENKYKARKSIIKLVEGYSWVIQVTDFEDAELHEKCIFYRHFAKYLRTGDNERIDASKLVEFVKFKQKKTRDGSEGGAVNPVNKTKVGQYSKVQPKDEDVMVRIDELIKELNELFGLGLDPKTQSPFVHQLINILSSDKDVEVRAKNNTEQDLQLYITKKIEEILVQGQDVNADFSDKVLENVDMKTMLVALLTSEIFNIFNNK